MSNAIAGRIVLLALILAFLPAFPANVVPSHDALQVYTTYWTYISGLITEGRLPEWIPYSRYGTPSTPILMYLTPVAYVTGALGALLNALWGFKDTLLLFKISVLLEYAIMAAGVMRLGTLLFRSRWVAAGVAILAIFSSPWIHSLDANFHAFYMISWILAELTLAARTAKSAYLGRAALLSVLACVGNVPYYPPFLLLQLFVFSLPLAWAHRQEVRRLLLDVRTWLWLGVALAMAGIHFVALVKGMDGLAIFSPGRDPLTNRSSLRVFLTYAGNETPLHLLREFRDGHCVNGDNTFYMGLATLVLVPLSFLMRSTPLLRAIRTLAGFVLLFSMGGLVTAASYWFPGMAFYRHVALVYGLFRLLAFFCAGYVIDRCLSDPEALAEWRTELSHALRRPLVLTMIAVATVDLVHAHYKGAELVLSLVYYVPFLNSFLTRLCGYALLLWLSYRLRRHRLWPALLMAALVLDLLSFWALGWVGLPRLDERQAAVVKTLAVPKRLADPGSRFTAADELERGRLFRFVARTRPLHLARSRTYVHAYFWTGEDPCVPRARTDFLAMSVARLFRERGIKFTPTAETERRVLQDPVLATALACGHPRIVSSARILRSTRGYDWITMTVENSTTGAVPLAVSEAMHAGWQATIDGAAAAMAPPYDALLGVRIPPGRHDVAFRFHQPLVAALRTLEGLFGALAAVGLLLVSLQTFWTTNTFRAAGEL